MSVKNTINIYCVLYVKTYNKYNIYAYPEGDDQFFKCMISMLYSWLDVGKVLRPQCREEIAKRERSFLCLLMI